ncbi:hypothetical protein F8G81_07575 [Arthrobacter sp. CDRTa11]|uniref:hypothetical protein n=1 Tax=Arthrobacter sp. CDRTa11 TaxID=2651199 RepID=UPI002265B72E|nr:hypothetical protein [Arthrobacter sp. CDRTa11]UZX02493.1 hypothetical protein F8G81_07575 [Arthrobacter sp. CDRTa11]
MTLPAATAEQVCLRGPADGTSFEPDGAPPPKQFIAAVHHGTLCCGEGYDEAEDHGDGPCDCMPPTRGLYALDLDRSVANGTQWVYVYEREVP